MEFFDDTRNFGVLTILVGVVLIGAAVYAAIKGLLFSAAGEILGGIVILLSGYTIFSGKAMGIIDKLFPEGRRSKFGVIIGYSAATGVATIIGGVFDAFDSVGYGIGGIVVGILILLVVWIVTNERKTAADKILWLLLVLFYFLALVLAMIEACKGGVSFITGIASMLIYLMAFKYLFDVKVRSRF